MIKTVSAILLMIPFFGCIMSQASSSIDNWSKDHQTIRFVLICYSLFLFLVGCYMTKKAIDDLFENSETEN